MGANKHIRHTDNIRPVSIEDTDSHRAKETLTEKRFFEWYVDDISVSLRARSGSYGGGSEVLIIERRKKQ